MTRFLTLALLCGTALAQLPDAPVPAGVRFSDYATPSMRQPEPRSHKPLWALAGVVAFDTVAGLYDAHETTHGLHDGSGYVEGNPWLIGTHPSYRALEARNVLQMGLAATPGLLSWAWRRKPLAWAFLVGPVVDGVKHLQGARAWVALEK